MNCFFSSSNKYMKRCNVRVCNMILQYVNFPLSARRFFRLFLFHNNETQRKVFALNNKDTSDSHVYAYMRVYIYAYVRITIHIHVCPYNHTRMRVKNASGQLMYICRERYCISSNPTVFTRCTCSSR